MARCWPAFARALIDEVLAEPAVPGAWYRDWRVMSVDGSCMHVAEGCSVTGRPATLP